MINKQNTHVHYEALRNGVFIGWVLLAAIVIFSNGLLGSRYRYLGSGAIFLDLLCSTLMILAVCVLVLGLDRVYFQSLTITPTGILYRGRGREGNLLWEQIERIEPEQSGGDVVRLRAGVRLSDGSEVTALPLSGFGAWRTGRLGKSIREYAPRLLE